ncbi:helix-turn-helix domain-containing protein [Chengkuizengella sediminis]|uniref:helix-turn-helix domain-containing protein n=1 Tax=Chengkuizengella sediminis TaxID=1885917 RepID=UPI001389EA26|nr:hypothetical protein [Chengkuizengella sediminis]NDI36345.1 hypothetical protein [Chengkuizengella sediminis]
MNSIDPDSLLNIYKSTNTFSKFNNSEEELDKLKNIRESRGISITQMAEKLEMTEEDYKKFEQFGGIQSDKEAIKKVNVLYKNTIKELDIYKVAESLAEYNSQNELYIENDDMSGG